MTHARTRGLLLAAAVLFAASGTAALAQQHDERGAPPHAEGHPEPHGPAAHPAEPHPGPSGYQRPAAPQGWDARPKTFDRATYQHNFQAARAYKIGPYHRPAGWHDHHWGYGETLPRAYWASQYLLADYWLFGLEVPPVDYEWVRVGNDALLINTANGEVLQAEYGVFG
jgi:Ni/Co efflux regulator RcnB